MGCEPTTTTVISGVSEGTEDAVLCATAWAHNVDRARDTASGTGFLVNNMFFSELLEFLPSLGKSIARRNVTN